MGEVSSRLLGMWRGVRLVWMFRRLTAPAWRAVQKASLEAARLGHRDLGSEHLLMGIMTTEGASAALVLRQLGVEFEDVLSHIENMVWNVGRSSTGKRFCTENFIRSIDLALEEAERMGRPFAGTEHLLLGLLRDERSVAANLLAVYQVTTERVREQIAALMVLEPLQRAGR
ncbi:MAG TPA: Clp protease N-terminal domain-containing protein [Candidatus Xenobia bacterium]|jgi:ATP-dependent Clp protease ATP-binding subunit ClpC